MKRFSFQVRAAGSTYPREALAGATTFLTMCYIVVVQPAMMESAGMDQGAVFTATCLASALATFRPEVFLRSNRVTARAVLSRDDPGRIPVR